MSDGYRPTLTWDGVAGAVSYEIWVDNESAPVQQAIRLTNLNSLSYTHSSDLPIGRYVFWVRARNAFGTFSDWSFGSRFEIATPPVLAGPPASTFNTRPVFSWNSQAATLNGVLTGAATYDFVMYRVNPTSGRYEFHRSAMGLTAATFTTPVDLPAGRYRTWVRGTVPARAGVPATVTNWSTPLDFVVNGPTVVTPIPNTTDTTPTITWQAVGAASGYEIYIALASSPSEPVVRVDNIGLTTFTVQDPLARGEYRVWVRAISAINGIRSGWSSPVTMRIVDGDSEATAEEFMLARMPVSVPEQMLVPDLFSMQSTVGMLTPAVIDEVVVATERHAVEEVPPVRVDFDNLLDGDEISELVQPETSSETDSVLAEWDQQIWWDHSSKTSEETSSENEAHSAGVLGALFAMAPRSMRKRRKPETGK